MCGYVRTIGCVCARQTLDMRDCQIGPFGMDACIQALAVNTTLTSWNLLNTMIGIRGLEKVANLLRTQTTLTDITLS